MPGCLRRDRVSVLLFSLDGASNRPNEAEELAPHRGHDLRRAFAPPEQFAVATMESVLCLPGHALHLVAEHRLPFAQGAAHRRPVAGGPRRLHDDPPEVRMTGLGDVAVSRARAAGVHT